MSEKDTGQWETHIWPHFQSEEQPNPRMLSSRCSCFKPLSSSDTNALICLMSIPWRFCGVGITALSVTPVSHLSINDWQNAHIIRGLQIPGLLTEIAKDVGEMFIPDLIEDLNESSDMNVTSDWSAAIAGNDPPYPESSAWLWCFGQMR